MQDISRLLGVAIRWLPLVLVFALGAGVVAYAFASSRPVVVEATGAIRVDPGLDASIQDRTDAVLAAVGYASQMQDPGFAQAIVSKLGLEESRDELVERLTVDVDADAEVGLIELAVRSTDPQQAQAIAKAYGDELIARKTRELNTRDVRNATQEVRTLESDVGSLRRQLRNLRAKSNKDDFDLAQISSLPGEIAQLQSLIVDLRPFTASYVRNLPSWVVEPRLPTDSVAAGPLTWALLAVVVGGMAGAGLAFTFEFLRTAGKVREERDLELVTGQATLGTVFERPRDAKRGGPDRLVMLGYPKSDEAEAYRGLVARIGFSGGSARTLMVAGAKSSDAKSLVAANIAVAYAEAGRNVILVDADYRSPRVHSFFGVANDRGLTTILGNANVPLGWTTVPSPHPRLGLMPSGPVPRENSEPLGPRQLNALLRRLLQAADLIIFDSPSIESSLDAAVLAEELQGTLLVVPRDSRAVEAEDAAHALQAADSEFVGAVLYRKRSRSRKGAKAKVAPAPDGWGPTWPVLFEQPARIPAVVRSTRQAPDETAGPVAADGASMPSPSQPIHAPASGMSAAAQPSASVVTPGPSATPGPAAPHPAPAPPGGPYAASFRSQPFGRPVPPAPAPPSPRAQPANGRSPATPPTASTTPAPAAASAAPRDAPAEAKARLAIPVQPEAATVSKDSPATTEPRSTREGTRAPASNAPHDAGPSTGTRPQSPESVPG